MKKATRVIHICLAYATLSSYNVNFQERVQYCVSLLLSPYTTLNTIQFFCYAQSMHWTHTHTHGWYWCCHWLDTTSSSSSSISRTIFVRCVYQMHTYIFNKTNSTIYQLKRDERIEIECIGVAHKSMHMKGYDICMDTWAYVAVELMLNKNSKLSLFASLKFYPHTPNLNRNGLQITQILWFQIWIEFFIILHTINNTHIHGAST